MRVESASLWERRRSSYPRTSCNIALLFNSYIQETIRWYSEIEHRNPSSHLMLKVHNVSCAVCEFRSCTLGAPSLSGVLWPPPAHQSWNDSHISVWLTCVYSSPTVKKQQKMIKATVGNHQRWVSCHEFLPDDSVMSPTPVQWKKLSKTDQNVWGLLAQTQLFVNRLTPISLESICHSGICCHHFHHQTDA